MEDIFKSITDFLSGVFKDSNGQFKIGGILSTAAGAGLGYYFGGGPIGALLGAVGGVVLGGVVNSVMEAGQPPKDGKHAPELVRPKVVEEAQQTVTIPSNEGPQVVTLPKPDKLPNPWKDTGLDKFLTSVKNDTSTLTSSPSTLAGGLPLLQATLKERNQPIYDTLTTVYQHHKGLEEYNTKVRPVMMRDLGLDEKSVFKPPVYEQKLDFTFVQKDRADRVAREARHDLKEKEVEMKLDETSWKSYSPPQQLALMEKSVNNRKFDASKRAQELKIKMEAQQRKVPIDLDFSFSSFKDRMKWVSFSLFADSSDTRVEKAFKNLFEGKPNEQVKSGGKTYLLRDEAGERKAEEEFRSEMESLIAELTAKGTYGGADAAQLERELIALIIEERRLAMDSSMIQHTKDQWLHESRNWAERVKDFPDELKKYNEMYAAGGTGSALRIVQVIDSPVMGNPDAEKEAKAIKARMAESLAQMRKVSDGVKALATKLDVKSLEEMQPVDIEKDIKSLPDSNAIMASSGKEKDFIRDGLEKKAKEYNDKLAAWKASKTNKTTAELQVWHESLAGELAHYVNGAQAVYNGTNKAQQGHLAELEKESKAKTPLEGYSGVIYVMSDVRQKPAKEVIFYGVKKGDEVIITGMANKDSDKVGKIVFFGKDLSDIEKGVKFNPKTMDGALDIMRRAETTPIIGRALPGGHDGLEADVLQSALASVKFAPVKNASDKLVMPALDPIERAGKADLT